MTKIILRNSFIEFLIKNYLNNHCNVFNSALILKQTPEILNKNKLNKTNQSLKKEFTLYFFKYFNSFFYILSAKIINQPPKHSFIHGNKL